jgi:hypothetical protein
MHVRIESTFPISVGTFKPVKQRRVASVGHSVHWYRISYRDLDAFLREVYRYYARNYGKVVHEYIQYQWYASLTIYLRGTTVSLNLAYSRLYHNPNYRIQFRRELSGDFGFYPASADFWECDTELGVHTYSSVRVILNEMMQEVTK